jgi:hypothetical protein
MSRDRFSEALRQNLESLNLEPGKVHVVEIRHDDDCAHWRGEPCDCEPEIISARLDDGPDEVLDR